MAFGPLARDETLIHSEVERNTQEEESSMPVADTRYLGPGRTEGAVQYKDLACAGCAFDDVLDFREVVVR